MPIGSSPFLTADVDESARFQVERCSVRRLASPGDIVSARLELIRRRVVTGYYSHPLITAELARRLADERALAPESDP
jgi:hypothetical protein